MSVAQRKLCLLCGARLETDLELDTEMCSACNDVSAPGIGPDTPTPHAGGGSR
jgi:hypothetical protein